MSKTNNACEKSVIALEKRFKKIANISEDISTYPIPSNHHITVDTNKSKSKEFGEVFTPLSLVDEMLDMATSLNCDTTTIDIGSGYGQFSIRLIRKLFNKYPSTFSINEFLINNHSFNELQLSSCYKLLSIFGTKINLFIGDARELSKLPGIATGIWCYVDSMKGWAPITATVNNIYRSYTRSRKPVSETVFVKRLENIITILNKGYSSMKTETINLNHSANTRMHALKLVDGALNELNPNDKSIYTPPSVCADICRSVAVQDRKTINVLFNAEIVEHLVHIKKIDPKQITFSVNEAKAARAKFVMDGYGVNTCLFANNEPKTIRESFGTKHWDLGLSNSPYTRGLDLKILRALKHANICTEYVWVHPPTWLFDQKNIFPLYVSFKEEIKDALRGVKLFNGCSTFKCEGLNLCVITHLHTGHNGAKIQVEYAKELGEEGFYADQIGDITKFGKAWLDIVKPFFTKIEGIIRKQGNIWSHNTRHIDADKEYCQLAAIIGNTSKESDTKVKDDFYTMTIKDSSENKGIRQPNLNRPGNPTPTFAFPSTGQRDNFLAYLNCDIPRFCFALLKSGKNAATGEMAMIPWMDFTKSWDDEKLSALWGIEQKTLDYIRSFLPDYYGIRKNSR